MVNNGDVHIEKPSDCLVAQCFSCSACVLTLGVFDLKRRCTEWSNQIKSNQITFIVTSPQHKCLGEWNSYECAPDSAEKQQTIYLWTDSAKKTTNNLHMDRQCKKNNKQFTYGQTVQKKQTNNLHMDRQCKKNNKQFTYGQTVQKKTNNLHMDRQCKKQQQTIYIWTDSAKKTNKQFTYGQTVQKKQQTIYIWTDSAKKTTNNLHMDRQCKKKQQTIYIWTDSAKTTTNNLHMDRQCKKTTTTAIYIWTDSAKKQQQFTYGQYIFTDCTEDNVQNTHTYTQYTVYYKDILNYQRHIIHRMGTSTLCTVSIHNVVYT